MPSEQPRTRPRALREVDDLSYQLEAGRLKTALNRFDTFLLTLSF